MSQTVFGALVIVTSLVLVSMVNSTEDLYGILGVSRSASEAEIKNSYRKQAKIWHPDKNKSPEARDMFTKINEAYEVLSDSGRRQQYDRTGKVGDPQHFMPASGHGFRFSQGGFQFFFSSGSSHRSDGITTHQFYNDVLPQSHQKPFLLSFYTDFCLQCANVETLWKSIHTDMESIGVELRSVHANRQHQVSQYCGISRVPTIAGIISGRVHSFYGQIEDKNSIINFLDNILPQSLITTVSSSNLDNFLSGSISRNRPRVLLFSPRDTPSFLYKVTAFLNMRYVDFGYICSRKEDLLVQRFGLSSGDKRLAVFKEYAVPTDFTAGHLGQRVLQSLVEGLTLILPRLSSPTMFRQVCESSPSSSAIFFCVILLVPDSTAYNDSQTAAFRDLASDKSLSDRFAYIDISLQSDFLASLQVPYHGTACPKGFSSRLVLILSPSYKLYDWFEHFCDGQSLLSHLNTLRIKPSLMKSLPLLPQLFDEEAPSMIVRVWNKVADFMLDVKGFFLALQSDVQLPVLSLLSALCVLCFVGVCLGVTSDNPNHRTTKSRAHHSSYGATHHRTHIEELNEDSYNLFIKTDQSLIALILLVNTSEEMSKTKLKKFLRIVSSYKSPRLRKYYLCYESHKNWLRSLLNKCQEMKQEDIDERELDCLSGQYTTAIALLNSKRQVCLFPDEVREENVVGDNGQGISDHMENFENWMERFADGTLKRYSIKMWPEWSSGVI